LKPSALSLPAAAIASLTAVVFAVTVLAQSPPAQAPAPAAQESQHDHQHPAPTNLKVLPKTMTGEEVHELMEKWEGSLGAHCSTCHTEDKNNIGPNGRPRLNFADDSKPEKQTARVMYTMTEDINKNYVSKIESSEQPVTCGTCHRGHLGPEPFVIPPEEHDARPAGAAVPKK
jgi:hypothetical protein